jgi:hypothetical protein
MMVAKMAYEGKRRKIDTHHEKEDMSTRNTEQNSDPTREISQISRCASGPPTTVEGTYSEKEETT